MTGVLEGAPELVRAAYIGGMDLSRELSQFLTSRRGGVTPEQAGLPTYGQRRVPGLRREEVASLAGVSVELPARLSRPVPARLMGTDPTRQRSSRSRAAKRLPNPTIHDRKR